MSDAMEQLKAIGKPVPAKHVQCTRCGLVYFVGEPGFKGAKSVVSHERRRQPATSFRITGCERCGHILHPSGRDLTRAEVAELAACPDFGRIRSAVDEHLTAIGLWG